MSLKTKPLNFRSLSATLAVGLLLGLSVAVPAYATDSQSGYRECNPNKKVKVKSSSSKTGLPSGWTFTVGHTLVGGSPSNMNWSTIGHHQSNHGVAGGSWAAATTGTFTGSRPSTSC